MSLRQLEQAREGSMVLKIPLVQQSVGELVAERLFPLLTFKDEVGKLPLISENLAASGELLLADVVFAGAVDVDGAVKVINEKGFTGFTCDIETLDNYGGAKRFTNVQGIK